MKDLTKESTEEVYRKAGECLPEELVILDRWTECHLEVHNSESFEGPAVLACPTSSDEFCCQSSAKNSRAIGSFRNVHESELEKQKTEQERRRLRWTHIHPDHWSTVEVASWLNYIADEHKFSVEERSNIMEAFEFVTGSQLLSMTKEQFLQADPTKGGLLFEIFKEVLPAGLSRAPDETDKKEGFLLPPINEDSGSTSSRDTSPALERKHLSV